MEAKIKEIEAQALCELDKAQDLHTLDIVKNKYLSRNSEFNNLKKGLKDLPNEKKPVIGALLNEVSKKLNEIVQNKSEIFYKKELEEKLLKEEIDITLDGKYVPLGRIHPLTKTVNEIVDIFNYLGFSLIDPKLSPEVEVEKFNFDLLNFPPEHPAKDMQDTFYTDTNGQAQNVILRSQTSNSQVREMMNNKPPIKIISPGRVYRNETVSARKNNLFHQIEGLYVDKGVTIGQLKGVLNEFIRLYFGSSRPTRYRSSYFPFTEPSVEIDVECIMCRGKGCPVCSNSGWLEILGAGMVDPNVLSAVDIDPDIYSGFAFGMGVERLTMLKYAIDDIRLFFNNDKRFLDQF